MVAEVEVTAAVEVVAAVAGLMVVAVTVLGARALPGGTKGDRLVPI